MIRSYFIFLIPPKMTVLTTHTMITIVELRHIKMLNSFTGVVGEKKLFLQVLLTIFIWLETGNNTKITFLVIFFKICATHVRKNVHKSGWWINMANFPSKMLVTIVLQPIFSHKILFKYINTLQLISLDIRTFITQMISLTPPQKMHYISVSYSRTEHVGKWVHCAHQ